MKRQRKSAAAGGGGAKAKKSPAKESKLAMNELPQAEPGMSPNKDLSEMLAQIAKKYQREGEPFKVCSSTVPRALTLLFSLPLLKKRRPYMPTL